LFYEREGWATDRMSQLLGDAIVEVRYHTHLVR
jgi:hypothetical protein